MSIFIKTYPQWLAPALFALALAGCEGSSSDESFSLGGTVTGLTENGLTLSHKGENLAVAGKSFTFKQRLADGDAYNVSLTQDPNQQLCQLANASGRVSGRDVKDIELRCRGWRGEVSLQGNTIFSNPQIALDSEGNGLVVWSTQVDDQPLARIYSAKTNTWSEPQLLSEGVDSSRAVPIMRVAFTPDDNALVLWLDDTKKHLVSQRYLAASKSFESAQIISTEGHLIADTDLLLAIDAQGNAIAVWIDDEGDNSIIFANHYNANDTQWLDEPIALYTGTGYNLGSPDIAFDPAGNAILVWQETFNSGTARRLLSLHYLIENASEPKQGWSQNALEILPSHSVGFMQAPQIAIDAEGNALVTWTQSLDGDATVPESNILFSRSSSTTEQAWSDFGLIENESGLADIPRLAFDAQGNALAVWSQQMEDGSDNTSLRASRLPKGHPSWTEPELLESEAGHVDKISRLVVDPHGNALVVWTQHDDATNLTGIRSIYANRYSAASGRWGQATLLETANTDTDRPEIALSPAGNAIAVWERRTRQNDEANLGTNDFR